MRDFPCVKNSLVTAKEVEQLNSFFQDAGVNHKYKSNYTNVCEVKQTEISNEPLLASICEKLHSDLSLMIDSSDLKFSKLWFVSSTAENTDRSVLPYIPHFDKSRYLKAMVYLHDMTLEHGPVHFGVVNDDVDIEARRKNLPLDYKMKGLNVIVPEDLKEMPEPVIGSAGDVVFFDTNSAHNAGIVTKGYCRKVLRFDFELPSFNPRPSIMQRVCYRLKGLWD